MLHRGVGTDLYSEEPIGHLYGSVGSPAGVRSVVAGWLVSGCTRGRSFHTRGEREIGWFTCAARATSDKPFRAGECHRLPSLLHSLIPVTSPPPTGHLIEGRPATATLLHSSPWNLCSTIGLTRARS